MICPNCNREVTPLVLRKGLACSKCLTSFVDDERNFSFTKENDETFHLSEAAFYRGIKDGNNRLVRLAIELCKKACDGCKDAAGNVVRNPEAYVRMGYYYEKNMVTEIDGKDAGLEKSYRIMIAYEYYSLVCNGTLVPGDLDGHKSFTEVQKYAADRLLRMLADFPEGEQRNPRYSVKTKQAELARKGLVDAASAFFDTKKQDVSLMLAKDVGDLLDRQPNVLISVYRIRGTELLSLLPSRDQKDEWKYNLLYRAARDPDVAFRYYLNTSGTDRKASPVDVHRFEEFLGKVERTVRDDPSCTFGLIFFNGKYKPLRFKKSSDMKLVEKALVENSSTVDQISDRNEDVPRFVFYEDEVFYCVEKRGMKQLSTTFNDYILRGEIQ